VPTNDRLHLAVVGYGQVARLHTTVMANDGHCLDWLIGRRPEPTAAFAAECGFARHSIDLRRALDDPLVDAVLLCTPSEQHADQAAACLQAGKHVLVEIPLAMSSFRGRELGELARRLDLTMMVGHNHRYVAGVRWVRERVLRGDLTLQSITARYFLLRRENVGTSGYVRSWTDNLLWHHGQHSMDVVLWLLGIVEPGQVEVTSVLAEPDETTGIPMDMTLAVRTPADQLGTVALSYNSFVNLYDYVVVARESTVIVDDYVVRGCDGILLDYSDEGDGARVLQNREFVAAIREGRPPATSAESILPALDVLQQAQDASRARSRSFELSPT
jgi:2-hydroxy-4-carboxymuconate semialdehyde hemiacetal dehydrogenase